MRSREDKDNYSLINEILYKKLANELNNAKKAVG